MSLERNFAEARHLLLKLHTEHLSARRLNARRNWRTSTTTTHIPSPSLKHSYADMLTDRILNRTFLQFVLPRMNAIYRAGIHACRVLDANTRLGYHIRHRVTSPLLSFPLAARC